MDVAFIAPARDKAGKLEPCVRSMLAQDYSPMDIVFSDQGSTDGTYEEIERLIADYAGPNNVRLLRCPVQGPRGQSGVNAHIDWIVNAVPAEVYILSSIDDYPHQSRASFVMKAYEEHQASMVCTCQRFLNPYTLALQYTAWPLESKHVTGREVIERKVGGSSSLSFTSEFYHRIGGLSGQIISDIYMAYLASQDKGLYFLALPLHTYVQHADSGNTGLGGQMLAANDDPVRMMQLTESAMCEMSITWTKLAVKVQELWGQKNDDDQKALFEEIANTCYSWCVVREAMNARRVAPVLLAA